MSTQWPLSDEITGSFSITVISNTSIRFCNHCIGIYPLYYYIQGDTYIISTDIHWMAYALNEVVEFDEVGIIQKLFGRERVNIGARTILKGVKRLLLGELI
ncbi:MAG: hypothetical protein H6604_01020 [Flavobacteriales bacterium]|nr:hypothetical protein [Flavobacteriales bacterium]